MADDPPNGWGLYVHVPYCSAICPYCDFSVLTGPPAERRRLVDHLLAEANLWAGVGGDFDTVYLGGGTPSILPAADVERLVAGCAERLGIGAGARIFLEANPEDVTDETLAAWRRLGVATLSLGVQSFDAGRLAFLGRRHSGGEARRACERALAAGFDTVSLDLIYGLPGDADLAAWRRDLEEAVALGPHHLSCYQLTIHPRTPFGYRHRRGELAVLDDDRQAAAFELTHHLLAGRGYTPYEVSNFARHPRHRSLHNEKYWRHAPYLGLGPSAHSFDGARRWWNHRKIGPWRREVEAGRRPIAGDEALSPRQLALEALMLGFRTTRGVDLAEMNRRWGVDLEPANGAHLTTLVTAGFVERRGARLAPTRRGLAIADSLAAGLVIPGDDTPRGASQPAAVDPSH